MYRFIIIDDEPLIRQGLLKKIQAVTNRLIYAGEADNGEDALNLIQTEDPHLIFTDMRMPVMDGKSLLRQLQHQYPDKKIIVISGYSDFEYMQEAISARVVHYLLKPFSREEIDQAITKALDALESERSAKAEAHNITKEAEHLTLQGDLQSLLHYIAGSYPADNPPVFRSAPMIGLTESCQMILMTVYNPEGHPVREPYLDHLQMYLPHPQSSKLAYRLLVCDSSMGETDAKEEAVREAARQIGATGPQACIGISGIKHSLTELPQSAREASLALDCRAVSDQGRYYMYRDGDFQTTGETWERSSDLLFFIESGNAEKVNELVLDYFSFYHGKPASTIYQLKENCRAIIADVKKLISAYFPVESGRHSSTSLEAVLNVSFDAEEIRTYFLTVLTSAAELLREQSVYSSPNVIENVKMYVRKNMCSSITLEHLSSLFYISPSYLSYLFKEKTGENLIDYVNRERISRAKQLLRDSNDKIYKIAKTLGYDNTKYFFRLFKKVTGTTPEEYRRQNSPEGETI